MSSSAIGYAVAAAVCLAVASALQHQAVTAEQDYHSSIHLLWRLARNRRWTLGLAAAAAGVILHTAALHAGALVVVQPVLVMSVALALPVRTLLDRARPSAGQILAAAALAAGVAVFVTAANPHAGQATADTRGAAAVIAAGVVLAGLCSVIALRARTGTVTGFALGLAAGTLYGLVGGALKATIQAALRNPATVMTGWPLWTLAVLGAWGFIIHQRAYAHAPLGVSLPVLSVASPLTGLAFGTLVFRETTAHGALALLGQTLGLAVIVMSVTLLARPAASAGRGRSNGPPDVPSGRCHHGEGTDQHTWRGLRRPLKCRRSHVGRDQLALQNGLGRNEGVRPLTAQARTGRCGRRTAAVLCVLAALMTADGCTTGTVGSARDSAPSHHRVGAKATPLADRQVRRTVLLGHSVNGRAITAIEIGDPDSPARTLIVGCIHGNEPAGIAIAKALASGPVPREAGLWVITDLNPDGVAAGTRGNAHGVDLNRNFPYHWEPLGPPGNLHYAGPRPLSEPESRLAAALVRRLRPRLTIYYHQHLSVVDDSQGPRSIERRYAHAVGLPLRPLTDYPGSAVGWQDHLLGPTAFVVELPPGTLSQRQVQVHVKALMAVLPRA